MDPGEAAIDSGEGVVGITFHLKEDYVRPVWPNTPGEQQMMMHLDFEVLRPRRGDGVRLENGAVLAEYQPQDDVRVLLRPGRAPVLPLRALMVVIGRLGKG